MIDDARFHRGRNARRFVNLKEVVQTAYGATETLSTGDHPLVVVRMLADR
jgi:hypothetical protein